MTQKPSFTKITLPHADQEAYFKKGLGGVIGRCLESGHFYEERMLFFIEKLPTPGLILDVGSFVGTHTVFFAKFCECAHVHAYDDSRGWDHWVDHVAMNGVEDLTTLHKCRVGCSSDTELLDRVEGEVPVSLIKVDVEGDQMNVLAGAERILEVDRPFLFVELWAPDDLLEADQFLKNRGYSRWFRFNSTPTYFYAHEDSRGSFDPEPPE